MLKNTRSAWAIPSRLFHWAVAGSLLFTLGLGFYMTQFVTDSLTQFALTQTHKSWGFVVFVLAVLRIIWRIYAGAPTLPSDSARWERIAAHATHGLLYVLTVLLPLSGWIMASAAPVQDMFKIENKVFDLFVLPDPFVPGVKEIEHIAATIHQGAAFALIGLLVLHLGAVAKHTIIKRDGVLSRMTIGPIRT